MTYLPKRMKPSSLQQCMTDIYRELFSYGNIARRMFSRNLFNATFGVGHGFSMKRLSQVVLGPVTDYYVGFLRRIEDGLYDENETLREDQLALLERLPIPRPIENQVDSDAYRLATMLCVTPGLARYSLKRLRARFRGGRSLQTGLPS